MSINEQAIVKLEEYLYEHIENPRRAATMTANIIGVAIDLKPAASEFFYFSEMEHIDPLDLLELLKPLDIKAWFFHNKVATMGQIEWIEDVVISKDLSTAIKLKKAGDKITENMDDYGQILDQAQWESATFEIGTLLGYPQTAVEYFLHDTDIDNPERTERMSRNRYYAHSPEHEEEEFQTYDLKLNQAVDKYAQRSAKLLTEDPKKRWLS